MDFFELIFGIISLIAIYAFFLLVSRAGDLRDNTNQMLKQNEEALRLLRKLAGEMTADDKAKQVDASVESDNNPSSLGKWGGYFKD